MKLIDLDVLKKAVQDWAAVIGNPKTVSYEDLCAMLDLVPAVKEDPKKEE